MLPFWLSLEFFHHIMFKLDKHKSCYIAMLHIFCKISRFTGKLWQQYLFTVSQSNSDKVLSYKAEVYCSVVSQEEVKVQSNLVRWRADNIFATYMTINQLIRACIRFNLHVTPAI